MRGWAQLRVPNGGVISDLVAGSIAGRLGHGPHSAAGRLSGRFLDFEI